jgi:hypothetical protein
MFSSENQGVLRQSLPYRTKKELLTTASNLQYCDIRVEGRNSGARTVAIAR